MRCEYAVKTARMPLPQTMIAANAPSRSRDDRVGRSSVRRRGCGRRRRRRRSPPSRSRRARRSAAVPRRAQAGTSTAASRQRAAAASSESAGESASQSTCGVSIFTAYPPRGHRPVRTAASRRPEPGGADACCWTARAVRERVLRHRCGPDGERDQAPDERHAAPRAPRDQVPRRVRDGRADLPVQDAGDQPQHVHRREHDRDRADDRVHPVLLEDAGEHEELTGERARARAPRARSRPSSSAASRAQVVRAPCLRAAGTRRWPCAARSRRRAGTASPRRARG